LILQAEVERRASFRLEPARPFQFAKVADKYALECTPGEQFGDFCTRSVLPKPAGASLAATA
jgi:hypothetical protein